MPLVISRSNALARPAPRDLLPGTTLLANVVLTLMALAATVVTMLARAKAVVEREIVPLAGATALAANGAAGVFNSASGCPEGTESTASMPPKKRKSGRLEKGVMRFYGAVGNTLCATLWDPGSSVAQYRLRIVHLDLTWISNKDLTRAHSNVWVALA